VLSIQLKQVQAKQESSLISDRFRRREESEESNFGRIDMEHFCQLMQELQQGQRTSTAIAGLASRYQVSFEAVSNLAKYVSIPTIHKAVIDAQPSFVARWK
jgi:hypothetical protein